MVEEKLVEGGNEGGELKDDKIENAFEAENKIEAFEEKVNPKEKIKEAQDKIAQASSGKPDEKEIDGHVKNIAKIEKSEDQVKKLTEIAIQEGPKKALKVARALNNNYVLDEMHDRLIDEEELRAVLLKKSFIDKV